MCRRTVDQLVVTRPGKDVVTTTLMCAHGTCATRWSCRCCGGGATLSTRDLSSKASAVMANFAGCCWLGRRGWASPGWLAKRLPRRGIRGVSRGGRPPRGRWPRSRSALWRTCYLRPGTIQLLLLCRCFSRPGSGWPPRPRPEAPSPVSRVPRRALTAWTASLERALDEAGDDTAVRAVIMMDQTVAASHAGDLPEAIGSAELILELAERTADKPNIKDVRSEALSDNERSSP